VGVAEWGVERWGERFGAFHARFAPFFYRQEVRERSARYVRALPGPVERKNGWQLAEAAGEPDPQGMQRLLRTARWDAEAVRDELQRFVAERFGAEDGVFVFDETGFLKKGSKSAGVQRQYSGTVDNCQVGVFLTYTAAAGHASLDRRLYLPREWAEDPARRRAAAVPAEVPFRTKPELAWEMLERARAQGMPGRWVTGDSVYGQDPALRARLEAAAPALHYVLAIPATTPVWAERPAAAGGVRAWAAHTPAEVAAALPEAAWRRVTVAAGAKGPRVFEWAALRVAFARDRFPGPERWLLVRRSTSAPAERAYYASNAPPDTPLQALARVAGARWPIEQCFEEAKGEAGLDHYEVRRYDAWHRHITLALLAHTFLADLRPGPGGKSGPRAGRGGLGALHPPDRARGAAPAGGGAAAAPALARPAPGLVHLAPKPPGDRPPLPLPPPPRPRHLTGTTYLTLES